jgi:hypothetical protein
MKGMFNWIHFVFTVSTGATIICVLATPARKRATRFLLGISLPSLSRKLCFIIVFNPNLIPALGINLNNVGAKPQ